MWYGLESEEYDRIYKDKVLIRRILRYFSPYKHPMYFTVFLLTLSSISSALIPILTTVVLNYIENNTNVIFILFAIVITFALNVLGWVFNYFRTRKITRVIGDVVLDLRRDATNAILNHDLSFFDRNPIGKIVSRINTDSRDVGQIVELALDLVSSFFIVIFLLIVMVFMNLMLFFTTVISFPLFFIVALAYRKIARRRALLGQRALASVNAYVKESFSGIQIAKTFRQEQKLYETFNEVNDTAYKVNLRRGFVFSIVWPALSMIQGLVLSLIVFTGGSRVLDGSISIGDLNLFLSGLSFLFFPLLSIASFWPVFQTGMAASERIFALIDTLPLIVQNDNTKPPRLKGEIEFKNVNFRYEASKEVFQNFNLKIEPGESLAIVGHTGAGKSSLAKLIARFYEFQEGDILVDGISIRNYNLKKYREQIGII
ncbi:MAG: ABC transporter ATP-binding protein, partial [Candidatus Thorarchaeota archaeon]